MIGTTNLILPILLTLSVVNAQVCNNTCGTGLVYNNRCDELGNLPLCAPGTDCADCQMMFPTWQVVIASVSFFILVVAMVALFCFRDQKQNTTVDVEKAKGTAKPEKMKDVKPKSKDGKDAKKGDAKSDSKKSEGKKTDAQKSTSDKKDGKKTADTKDIELEEKPKKPATKPGAPKLPSQRSKVVEVA